MAQRDPGVSLGTFRCGAPNSASHALANRPVIRDHTDARTENTSVPGNYPVPRVIDHLDEELLLVYLKFNNLPMKSLLKIA